MLGGDPRWRLPAAVLPARRDLPGHVPLHRGSLQPEFSSTGRGLYPVLPAVLQERRHLQQPVGEVRLRLPSRVRERRLLAEHRRVLDSELHQQLDLYRRRGELHLSVSGGVRG
uniref:(northern house mosquito) hypothetical protein n=1 Tax=Culex pipiens TaxID=7175 RepID=A0A8D8JQV7_CULPI